MLHDISFYFRVDEELIVRVADFGLSRDIYSRDYYRLERRVKLPVKWLPPESLNDNIFNEKTDVVSRQVTHHVLIELINCFSGHSVLHVGRYSVLGKHHTLL